MFEQTETTTPIISQPDDKAGTIQVVGGHTRMLVRSDQVNGAYAILEQQIPSGKGPPLHVHSHETEIFYVVSGEFEFRVGGDIVIGKAGTSAACPRDIPHTFRNVGADTARLLVTIIPGNFGNFFLDADANADPATIRALAAKYGVEILE